MQHTWSRTSHGQSPLSAVKRPLVSLGELEIGPDRVDRVAFTGAFCVAWAEYRRRGERAELVSRTPVG